MLKSAALPCGASLSLSFPGTPWGLEPLALMLRQRLSQWLAWIRTLRITPDEGKESASGTCFESWAWSYSHLVTRSGTAKKSSFQDRLPFMKVDCTGLLSFFDFLLGFAFNSSFSSSELLIDSTMACKE